MGSTVVIILTSAMLSVMYGCQQSTVTNSNEVVFPDSLVSYKMHVQPFLNLRCGQCHSDAYAAGGLRLTYYSYLLYDRPNLVVPGQPDESLVNQVLERVIYHAAGQIETIPQNQVKGMRTWVREGAQNN